MQYAMTKVPKEIMMSQCYCISTTNNNQAFVPEYYAYALEMELKWHASVAVVTVSVMVFGYGEDTLID